MIEIEKLPEWQEHWLMRKRLKFPCTAKAKRQALNSIERLSKEGYDPALLLTRSTDMEWRSFWRHADCMKARPVLETVTPDMLRRSNSEIADEVIKRIHMKKIPPRRTSQDHLRQLADKLRDDG